MNEKAVLLAKEGHKDQKRRNGEPYENHCFRVSDACKNPKAKIVALCHDLFEDTTIDAQRLRKEGFPEYIIDAINSVTKIKGEKYLDFILRARKNYLGREVKNADLDDNLSDLENGQLREKYLLAKHVLNHQSQFFVTSIHVVPEHKRKRSFTLGMSLKGTYHRLKRNWKRKRIPLSQVVSTAIEYWKDYRNTINFPVDIRTVAFFNTIEEAINVVEHNVTDLWEHYYRYVVIEEMEPKFWAKPKQQIFFQWVSRPPKDENDYPGDFVMLSGPPEELKKIFDDNSIMFGFTSVG